MLYLSERGSAAVAAGRAHRDALEAELARALGAERVAAAKALLAEVIGRLGGADAVRARRVRPPA